MDPSSVAALAACVKAEVGKVVLGQTDCVELFLIALLCEGHLLLEGAPGTAKTLVAQCFASTLGLEFGRVQFTPDLMPGDVLGTNIFDFEANRFTFKRGPIFTQLLLADEINRTPPKTQAALLQAMQERAVTIDAETYSLGDGFLVIATQNPIEHHGTYPLPEAQLDRFLFKHVVEYPSRDEELAIVQRYGHRAGMPSLTEAGLDVIMDLDSLRRTRGTVRQVILSEDVGAYIVDLVRETRRHPLLQVGASPRAGAMIASAVRAYATLNGRDFAIPDDVKYVARPALRHRVVLSPRAEIDNVDPDTVIAQILGELSVPR